MSKWHDINYINRDTCAFLLWVACVSYSSKRGPQTAVSVSPGNLWEMQILWSSLKTNKSETPGRGPSIIAFYKYLQEVLMCTKPWEPVLQRIPQSKCRITVLACHLLRWTMTIFRNLEKSIKIHSIFLKQNSMLGNMG